VTPQREPQLQTAHSALINHYLSPDEMSGGRGGWKVVKNEKFSMNKI
jgi:hypothetical protein